MKDERTLSFVNLFAVLGALPWLCDLDETASGLIGDAAVSVGFAVRGGPSATLFFGAGRCRMAGGTERCEIKLPFSSCARFNALLDGGAAPIPSKGLLKAGFLTGPFTALTERLTAVLRPEPEALEDPAFFRLSTTVLFHVIVEAAAQIANEDPVGQTSASFIADGPARLSIMGGPSAALCCRDHRLLAVHQPVEKCMSYLEFQDLQTARDIFDGRLNAVAAVGLGQVRIGGMISQIDNINRILDRVSAYLA